MLTLAVKNEQLPLVLPGVPSLDARDLPSFLKAPESYPAYLAMKLNQYSNLEKTDWIFGNTFEALEGKLCVQSIITVFVCPSILVLILYFVFLKGRKRNIGALARKNDWSNGAIGILGWANNGR